MKNLTVKAGPAQADDALRDLVMELEAAADDTPALGGFAEQVETQRVALAARVEAHKQAQSQVRVGTRRVKRRDRAVKKAAVALSQALKTYQDEPNVGDVLGRAYPVSATEGTAGLASEGQRRFVENAVAQVRAVEVPPKVKQRAEALAVATGRLSEAVVARGAAQQNETLERVKLDQQLTGAVELHNHLYFKVGDLVGKAAAEEIFGR